MNILGIITSELSKHITKIGHKHSTTKINKFEWQIRIEIKHKTLTSPSGKELPPVGGYMILTRYDEHQHDIITYLYYEYIPEVPIAKHRISQPNSIQNIKDSITEILKNEQ